MGALIVFFIFFSCMRLIPAHAYLRSDNYLNYKNYTKLYKKIWSLLAD